MDDQLRIAQIFRAPMGGLFRHVKDLTIELENRGHKLAIICANPPNDFEQKRVDDLADICSLGVHTFNMTRLPMPQDALAALKIRKIVKDLGIDIVHGHGAKGGLHARLAAKKSGAFYTPHGGILHYPYKSIAGKIFWNIERLLLSKTNSIIFESHFAHKNFTAVLPAKKYNIRVIHNGISKFETEKVHSENSSPEYDWLFLGELRELKGIDLFLRALKIISDKLNTPQRTLIVGAGAEADKYHSLARELGLSALVDFQSPQPAREAFSKAKYLVMPSRNESLPYVLLEAIGAGLPVIATNVGGISEILDPDDPFLIAPESPEAIANAMEKIISDQKLTIEYKEQRWQKISTNFSINTMVDQIEETYRKS